MFTTLKNGENVVAITFLFPCEILTEKKTYNALYLFAVATDTKYRNRGYMTKLLENIKKEHGLWHVPWKKEIMWE